jgi:hypothetical protein
MGVGSTFSQLHRSEAWHATDMERSERRDNPRKFEYGVWLNVNNDDVGTRKCARCRVARQRGLR